MPTRSEFSSHMVPTGAVRLRPGLFGLRLEEQVENFSSGDRCWRSARRDFILSNDYDKRIKDASRLEVMRAKVESALKVLNAGHPAAEILRSAIVPPPPKDPTP